MNRSDSIANISAALNAAQKELGSVKKGALNPHFKSNYADLTAVIDAVKETLNKHGITILQPHTDNCVETVLLHTSGEYLSSLTPIILAKENNPQALGSAISYARRYGLQSLVCLPAEDDDGEAAMDRVLKTTKKGKAQESFNEDF